MKSNFWNHVNRIQRAFASSVCMPVKRLKYFILVLKKAWKNECGRNVVVIPKVPRHFWAAQLSNTDWVYLLFSSLFFVRNLYKRHDSAPLRVYTMLNKETIASLLAMTHLPFLFLIFVCVSVISSSRFPLVYVDGSRCLCTVCIYCKH